MAHIFKSTSVFIDNIDKLSQKYPTLRKDLVDEFCSLTFNEIFSKKYVLKDSGVAKILKVRVANSEQNKGKSSGFRIILVVDKNKEQVTFLNIFTKTGTEGKDNIDREELKRCLSVFKSENKAGSLIELDSNKSLNVKVSI